MKVIEDIHNFAHSHSRCAATIGKFDGVHIGHQLILRQLQEQARTLGVPSVVIVIEPHPEEFFASDPSACPARLSEQAEKLSLIADQGIDYVYVLPFDRDLCELSAEEYIEKILVDGLGVAALVIGNDFRFGHNRLGDFSLLQQYGARRDFRVIESKSCNHKGHRVSSTYVRQALAEARFDLVEELLGRPYGISGTVVEGKKLGRELGFPTCNVQLNRRNIPLHGVYACDVLIFPESAEKGREGGSGQAGEMLMKGAANIGYRPTVTSTREAVLEVHLLDFSGDVYGAGITVIFRQRIRDELKFDSLAALQAQIAHDVEKTRKFFGLESRITQQ